MPLSDQEYREYSAAVEFEIPRTEFLNLVREIFRDLEIELSIQVGAIEKLQLCAERIMAQIREEAQICASLENRTVPNARDIKLAIRKLGFPLN